VLLLRFNAVDDGMVGASVQRSLCRTLLDHTLRTLARRRAAAPLLPRTRFGRRRTLATKPGHSSYLLPVPATWHRRGLFLDCLAVGYAGVARGRTVSRSRATLKVALYISAQAGGVLLRENTCAALWRHIACFGVEDGGLAEFPPEYFIASTRSIVLRDGALCLLTLRRAVAYLLAQPGQAEAGVFLSQPAAAAPVCCLWYQPLGVEMVLLRLTPAGLSFFSPPGALCSASVWPLAFSFAPGACLLRWLVFLYDASGTRKLPLLL